MSDSNVKVTVGMDASGFSAGAQHVKAQAASMAASVGHHTDKLQMSIAKVGGKLGGVGGIVKPLKGAAPIFESMGLAMGPIAIAAVAAAFAISKVKEELEKAAESSKKLVESGLQTMLEKGKYARGEQTREETMATLRLTEAKERYADALKKIDEANSFSLNPFQDTDAGVKALGAANAAAEEVAALEDALAKSKKKAEEDKKSAEEKKRTKERTDDLIQSLREEASAVDNSGEALKGMAKVEAEIAKKRAEWEKANPNATGYQRNQVEYELELYRTIMARKEAAKAEKNTAEVIADMRKKTRSTDIFGKPLSDAQKLNEEVDEFEEKLRKASADGMLSEAAQDALREYWKAETAKNESAKQREGLLDAAKAASGMADSVRYDGLRRIGGNLSAAGANIAQTLQRQANTLLQRIADNTARANAGGLPSTIS